MLKLILGLFSGTPEPTPPALPSGIKIEPPFRGEENLVMLDIETLGTRPGYVVLSIAAATFRWNGTVPATFKINLDIEQQVEAGLLIDPDTEEWWEEQSAEAYGVSRTSPQPVKMALLDLSEWFDKNTNGNAHVYAQGQDFDAPMLAELYRRFDATPPWQFYQLRDTRTAYDIADLDRSKVSRLGVHHAAMDDVLHQIKCVVAAYRKIREFPNGSR